MKHVVNEKTTTPYALFLLVALGSLLMLVTTVGASEGTLGSTVAEELGIVSTPSWAQETTSLGSSADGTFAALASNGDERAVDRSSGYYWQCFCTTISCQARTREIYNPNNCPAHTADDTIDVYIDDNVCTVTLECPGGGTLSCSSSQDCSGRHPSTGSSFIRCGSQFTYCN